MGSSLAERVERGSLRALVLLPLALGALPAAAQGQRAGDASAHELFRAAIENEIRAEEADHALWCFRMAKREDGQDKTFWVCQAQEGSVYRLAAVNGRALPPEQREAEKRRVGKLAEQREELRARQRKVAEDGKQARKLLASAPSAFLLGYQGTEGHLVKLQFWPNPKFHPSGHAESVFHHLAGTVTLDSQQKRLVEIKGTLTSEVKFGGGLFGHLDKGGTFWVRQTDLGRGTGN